MNLGHRARLDVIGEQFPAPANGEFDVLQTPLVGPFAGVADDDRQDVQT